MCEEAEGGRLLGGGCRGQGGRGWFRAEGLSSQNRGICEVGKVLRSPSPTCVPTPPRQPDQGT